MMIPRGPAPGVEPFRSVFLNDPEKALREFVRVAKENGIVSWGDEGFSKSYKSGVKRRILAKLNPGFLKPMPGIPEALHERKKHEV